MKILAILLVLFAAAVAMELKKSPAVLSDLGPGVQVAQSPSQILTGLERKPSQRSTGRCVEYGIIYSSHHISTIYNIYHWSDCAQQCYDHKSCLYWTWDQVNKHCFFKSSDAGREKWANTMSGSFGCFSEC